MFDLPLSLGFVGLAVRSPAAVGAAPSEFDDVVALAGQHDRALLAVEQLLLRFWMIERMRCDFFLVVEAHLPRANRWPLLDLRRGPEVGMIVILGQVPGVRIPHNSLLIRYIIPYNGSITGNNITVRHCFSMGMLSMLMMDFLVSSR